MSQKSLNDIKVIVATMMNEIHDEHANLISSLQNYIGQTKEYEDAVKVIKQIYCAKLAVLEKIYGEMGE